MTIWANTIVNNEENFIWFAIMSVIDHVDKILIWDTGSTDKTTDIIREIREVQGNKIEFREVGHIDKYQFPKMRQKMLAESNCDWILVLDGDEIWWEASIKQLAKEINSRGKGIEGIVAPMIVPVGDIFHLQAEEAGRYELLGKKGHLSLRAINKKIPGLHVDWPYGKESYLDEENQLVQTRKGIVFLDAPYLHVTHLKRSNRKRENNKFKYELGERVAQEFKFPEVFYKDFPSDIRSPWLKISGLELVKARLMTPLRKLKRKIL